MMLMETKPQPQAATTAAEPPGRRLAAWLALKGIDTPDGAALLGFRNGRALLATINGKRRPRPRPEGLRILDEVGIPLEDWYR